MSTNPNRLIFGDVRTAPTTRHRWTLRLASAAYRDYLAWQLGRDCDPPAETVRVYFERKADAHAACAGIRLILTEIRGKASDHGVFAADLPDSARDARLRT